VVLCAVNFDAPRCYCVTENSSRSSILGIPAPISRSSIRIDFSLLQVCELDMLESLILHNNGLPSLRREIGMLTNLVNLSLTGNYLAELPPTVALILFCDCLQ
jgi:Leucine-rich repeat (LRR) protein